MQRRHLAELIQNFNDERKHISQGESDFQMTFHFKTLEEVLLCPKSKTKLILDGESLVCIDPECRLQFQIRDEIPIMLIDEATELSVEEWEAVMRKQDQ